LPQGRVQVSKVAVRPDLEIRRRDSVDRLKIGYVKSAHGFAAEIVILRVSHHADNLQIEFYLRNIGTNVLPDRIRAVEIKLRHGLINDHYRRRARRVAFRHVAAEQNRNANSGEIPRSDLIEAGFSVRV